MHTGLILMDSEALHTFLTIYQKRSFSEAADHLGRSQPAISRRIALLEEELGTPLFDRTTNGIVLSQAGHVLLPYAERVIAAIRDCEQAMITLHSGETGPLSIAVVGTLANANLTSVLKQFSEKFPDVELTIRTDTSGEISKLVKNGQATIGIRYFKDHDPDIDCVEITKEHLQIACAPDHPLAGKTIKSLQTLSQEHWLAFPNTYRVRESSSDNIFAHFLTHGIPEINWTPIDSLTAQKRLIEANFGIAFLPESAITEELSSKTISTIKIKGFKSYNPVYLITRKKSYLSPATTKLIDLMKTNKT